MLTGFSCFNILGDVQRYTKPASYQPNIVKSYLQLHLNGGSIQYKGKSIFITIIQDYWNLYSRAIRAGGQVSTVARLLEVRSEKGPVTKIISIIRI